MKFDEACMKAGGELIEHPNAMSCHGPNIEVHGQDVVGMSVIGDEYEITTYDRKYSGRFDSFDYEEGVVIKQGGEEHARLKQR